MTPTERREVAFRRLAALWLAPSEPGADRTPLAVVEHHLAMQAQDLASGLWSIGVRTGGTVQDVLAAVDRGDITRTWPMRGTLHWVATADADWLTELLSGPAMRAATRVLAAEGLTDEIIDRAGASWAEHLGAVGSMTRAEAAAVLAAHGIDPSGQRTYHLLVRHHQRGLLLHGPIRRLASGPASFEPTFVLSAAGQCAAGTASAAGAGGAAGVLGREVALGREAALARLAERYVASHGPVTERDFAGWCDQPLRLVREAVALTAGRVHTEHMGEKAYLVHAEAPNTPSRASNPVTPAAPPPGHHGVLLLPGFDEWMLGYKDRRAQLTPEQERAVIPGGNGVFRGTLVADAAVVGTWRRSVARSSITVEVTPFVRVTRSLRSGADGAVVAYGRFWGMPARLRWVDG